MNKSKWLSAFSAGVLATGLAVGGASAQAGTPAPSEMRFVNVIKVTANAWFQNMNRGVVAFSKATGVKSTQTGPSQATAEGQVSIIQNLIPQQPTAIGIDPNSQQALEGVLGKAQKAGIFVFSQEAPQMTNTNFDLEAFGNAKYGQEMMDSLGSCMGGKGQYVTFVGHLTAASHMAWAQAELDEAKAKFPEISRATNPVVANENSEVAYQKTKELLTRYPNLKGFIGSASTDIPGIARAVTELGLNKKVCIVGTSVPSLTRRYVNAGTIQDVFLWDSSLTAHAAMNGALMMLQGKTVEAGTNLHVPGYTDIKKCTGKGDSPHCFQGDAILKLTKKNIGNYHF
ncbi:MAG: autoinducer 2 ABC transporter substrate-binding protein [Salinisphaera sp.]|jgi:simple sugar transport system substrate-binding protein|nr:autoinducer 2 ABC transporter substrate-binding protein [Salinisphaera sp.]